MIHVWVYGEAYLRDWQENTTQENINPQNLNITEDNIILKKERSNLRLLVPSGNKKLDKALLTDVTYV
ncbi:MAG: hypothetical protein AAF824_23830, partial [Bacteroidota bacterium]